uniref:Uncharacterized protein n=1 Tax=Cacopsylla melanoneura TaxID=428564 RepID=A0A8D8M247_9HEMI
MRDLVTETWPQKTLWETLDSEDFQILTVQPMQLLVNQVGILDFQILTFDLVIQEVILDLWEYQILIVQLKNEDYLILIVQLENEDYLIETFDQGIQVENGGFQTWTLQRGNPLGILGCQILILHLGTLVVTWDF